MTIYIPYLSTKISLRILQLYILRIAAFNIQIKSYTYIFKNGFKKYWRSSDHPLTAGGSGSIVGGC
jgi:hypothetical protein